uniref:SNF2 N-terminal domain-containing protein n=1 Tax=Solanum tuberosum TaxID=4113 RepID=M1APR3_SOLTU
MNSFWRIIQDDLDLNIHNVSFAETAEAPSDLIFPLLRYRKEWLAWSLKQETIFKGGILADEMGMGKTAEAIALVLAQRKLKKATSGSNILPSSPGSLYQNCRHQTTKAVLALESSYKWALTGTPLQNRIGELYSFYITKPLVTMGHENDGGDAMVLLKHKILKSLLLRRTKKERVVDLSLPTKTVIMRKDSLDVSEFNYYKSLHNRSREQFDRLVQAGTLMNNYGHIFAMITRLRQVTSCRHVFCKACLIGLAESVEKMPCPSCTKLLTFDFTANNDKGDSNSKPTVKGFRSSSILNEIQLDKFQTSTKIDALVFLMDPWWNPAVEQQAQDRIHRTGQYKPVWIVRFVIENTIEENIIELQEKKKLLFEGQVSFPYSRHIVACVVTKIKHFDDFPCKLLLSIFLLDYFFAPTFPSSALSLPKVLQRPSQF